MHHYFAESMANMRGADLRAEADRRRLARRARRTRRDARYGRH